MLIYALFRLFVCYDSYLALADRPRWESLPLAVICVVLVNLLTDIVFILSSVSTRKRMILVRCVVGFSILLYVGLVVYSLPIRRPLAMEFVASPCCALYMGRLGQRGRSSEIERASS